MKLQRNKEYWVFSRNWKKLQKMRLWNWSSTEVVLFDSRKFPRKYVFELSDYDSARKALKAWQKQPILDEIKVGDLVSFFATHGDPAPITSLVVNIVDKEYIEVLHNELLIKVPTWLALKENL